MLIRWIVGAALTFVLNWLSLTTSSSFFLTQDWPRRFRDSTLETYFIDQMLELLIISSSNFVPLFFEGGNNSRVAFSTKWLSIEKASRAIRV